MQTANTTSANTTVTAATPATKSGKPVRRDFYTTLVIRNNGAVVSDIDWKAVAKGETPREVRKQLKTAGMQAVRVFDKDAYEASRKTFRDSLKTSAKAERESMITEAFKDADIENNPRIVSALKTLLPLFRDAPTKKTITCFRNIIRSVSGSVDLTTPAAKAAIVSDTPPVKVVH